MWLSVLVNEEQKEKWMREEYEKKVDEQERLSDTLPSCPTEEHIRIFPRG